MYGEHLLSVRCRPGMRNSMSHQSRLTLVRESTHTDKSS